jgi:hypothetical protein
VLPHTFTVVFIPSTCIRVEIIHNIMENKSTSNKSLCSCDPRWNGSWQFHLIKKDDTAVLIDHYRTSSNYWYRAYIQTRSQIKDLSADIERLRAEVDILATRYRENNIRDLKAQVVSQSLLSSIYYGS